MTPNGRPFTRPMPMDVKLALQRDLTPDQAQTMLAQAQTAYFNLLTGQLPSGVETPQLGRVTYCATTAADLQRLIDYLNGIISSASSNGNGWGSSGSNVRKPFSFYGWP